MTTSSGKQRKPLRRTAWTLLLSGLLLTGAMIGAGALAVGQGQLAGPGRGHVARGPDGDVQPCAR